MTIMILNSFDMMSANFHFDYPITAHDSPSLNSLQTLKDTEVTVYIYFSLRSFIAMAKQGHTIHCISFTDSISLIHI
jgi:hypothetical protein